jgi:threonine/homoserine/homoserine lactone efflux protein
MNAVFATGGLILTAALTPGPNNFLVLKLAGERDLRPVLKAIGGILAGGIAMIALAQMGLAAFTSRHAWVREAILICGTSYLVALGLVLVYRSFGTVSVPSEGTHVAPNGTLALFVFQFINPKAWILALTVSAAAAHCSADQCDRLWPRVTRLLLFAALSTACLFAWAMLGQLAGRFLRSARLRAQFDCAMGLFLVACAGLLLLT